MSFGLNPSLLLADNVATPRPPLKKCDVFFEWPLIQKETVSNLFQD